jgi:hypothetical protein
MVSDTRLPDMSFFEVVVTASWWLVAVSAISSF